MIPRMKRLPENATPEIRAMMFLESLENLYQCNKRFYLPYGVKRKWYQFFVKEHPWMRFVNDPRVAPYLPKVNNG